MQKERGFAALGATEGPIKNATLGQNVVRLFGHDQCAELASPNRFAALNDEYQRAEQGRSNLRYGYVHKPVKSNDGESIC
jgi:hypothetical protein